VTVAVVLAVFTDDAETCPVESRETLVLQRPNPNALFLGGFLFLTVGTTLTARTDHEQGRRGRHKGRLLSGEGGCPQSLEPGLVVVRADGLALRRGAGLR
jgi:hypothetical protein